MQAGLVLKVLEHLMEGEAAANQTELDRLRAEVGVQRARANALQVQLEDSSRDQQAPPPGVVSGAGAGAGGPPLKPKAEEGCQKAGLGVWEPLKQPLSEATYHSEFL